MFRARRRPTSHDGCVEAMIHAAQSLHSCSRTTSQYHEALTHVTTPPNVANMAQNAHELKMRWKSVKIDTELHPIVHEAHIVIRLGRMPLG